jgi:hypothetical protein
VTPAIGAYGNMNVSAVRAPGFWEWDQAITREFDAAGISGGSVQFDEFRADLVEKHR